MITLGCGAFLLWKGFSRGFLASLIGPLALILGSIAAGIYYVGTKQVTISLCIGLFGPFVLTWILRFLLRSWNRVINPEKEIHFLSRFGGALLSLSWGLTMIIITVLLLVLIPPFNKPMEILSQDIHSSYLYHLVKPFDSMADKSNKKHLSSQENIKLLSQDKRIQDVIQDPQITAAINRKDYAYLISNPKIAAIMQDPELIKKMMTLYKDMAEEEKNTTQNTSR